MIRYDTGMIRFRAMIGYTHCQLRNSQLFNLFLRPYGK